MKRELSTLRKKKFNKFRILYLNFIKSLIGNALTYVEFNVFSAYVRL